MKKRVLTIFGAVVLTATAGFASPVKLDPAGGLVFYGDSSGGSFVAADAKTGKPLWHFNTGQSWKAGPMTFAIDGTQYIAVAAGSTIVVFSLR